MEERRKSERRRLVHQLMVFDRDTEELAGYLVDITTEGIMLMGKDPLEAGSTRNLRMLLPDKIQGSRQVAFDARSIWCRKNIRSGLFEMGLQLSEVADEDLETIRHLIEVFGTQD